MAMVRAMAMVTAMVTDIQIYTPTRSIKMLSQIAKSLLEEILNMMQMQ